MSVRQYIGARYVTKIYENSLDPSSAEWEANVNYEPLTLVTFNYGSYLSKKEVPASIGNPADNPAYWVQTGFYNGQIAQLQQEIDDIKAQTKNIIIIGDSYADGRSWTFDTYAEVFQNIMSDSNVYIYGESASGFGHFGVDGDTFEANLDKAYNDHTGIANNVTDVIVIGGSNDRNVDQNDIYNYMSNFITKAKTYFPNAKISVGFCGFVNTINTSDKIAFLNCLKTYRRCEGLGARYITGLEYLMHNYDHYTADGGHPDGDLSKRIGLYLYNWYTSGSAEDVLESAATITLHTDISTPASSWDPVLSTKHINGNTFVSIVGNRTSISWYNYIAFNIANSYLQHGLNELASFEGGCYYGVEDKDNGGIIATPITVQFHTATVVVVWPCAMILINKKWYLFIPNEIDLALSAESISLSDIVQIKFTGFNFTADTDLA